MAVDPRRAPAIVADNMAAIDAICHHLGNILFALKGFTAGVVDSDYSQLSRQLVRYYDANPTLAVANTYPSVAEGSMH